MHSNIVTFKRPHVQIYPHSKVLGIGICVNSVGEHRPDNVLNPYYFLYFKSLFRSDFFLLQRERERDMNLTLPFFSWLAFCISSVFKAKFWFTDIVHVILFPSLAFLIQTMFWIKRDIDTWLLYLHHFIISVPPSHPLTLPIYSSLPLRCMTSYSIIIICTHTLTHYKAKLLLSPFSITNM